MRDLRGPDVPIPDSVPEDLVAMYGKQARDAVRARRSRWIRLRARARTWSAAHDPAFLAGAAFLWLLILVCLALMGMAFAGNHLHLLLRHWRLRVLADERERLAHEVAGRQ